MNNPYDFLGVGRNATEKDIMDAYRRIAGEINNAGYSDSERTRKMDELNNAYDTILYNLRSGSGYANNGNNSQYSDVRQQLNSGRVDDAEIILDGIPTNMRNAEWNYLKGVVYQRRGWMNEAYRCYQSACSMDPQNREYSAAFNSLNNNVNSGYKTTRPQKSSSGCDGCDVCTGLLCADCCCECMGGDLISCC